MGVFVNWQDMIPSNSILVGHTVCFESRAVKVAVVVVTPSVNGT